MQRVAINFFASSDVQLLVKGYLCHERVSCQHWLPLGMKFTELFEYEDQQKYVQGRWYHSSMHSKEPPPELCLYHTHELSTPSHMVIMYTVLNEG